MQTPKSRNNSSGAPQKNSPRSASTEPTQKAFSPPQAGSSEPPQKASPRVVRQLKAAGPRYFEHTASSLNLATKPPKERSPRVSDHRSPKSPASDQPKRHNRVPELESQVSQLENDLSALRDQLFAIEASKKQAEKDAVEANQRALALSLKLEESQRRSSENEAISGETLRTEATEDHSSHELASALEEIAKLKQELETAAESDAVHCKNFEAKQAEAVRLKEALSETEVLFEEGKIQLEQSRETEAKTLARLEETLMAMEALRGDIVKATEGREDLASDVEKYRARVSSLEELVRELKAKIEAEGSEEIISSMKLEIQQLRYALEAAEIRYDEERTRNEEKLTKASEGFEEMKSESHRREIELEKSKERIEELESKLLDKENEIQCVSEENDALIKRIEDTKSKSLADFEDLNEALSAGREEELKSLIEEKETLKSQIEELIGSEEKGTEIESAKASEREALMRVGHLTEEIDESSRRVSRLKEELEAVRLNSSEMETELRRIKVQCDQWRKAAEAAAAMISAGNCNNNNNGVVERTGSMDGCYGNKSPRRRRSGGGGGGGELYGDEVDEDLMGKKKNANVLKRFWKKNQK